MSLTGFGATVLTQYKADTKQARAEVRKLKGEERKFAKQRLTDMEQHNTRLQKQISVLGKLAVAAGAAYAAWRTAAASLDTFMERQDLRLASQGVNVNKLRTAFNGLVTETRALQFAATLNNGAFEMTEKQMEQAARAVISLTNKGNDLNEVMTAMEKSLAEGNPRALRKFGIEIKGATNTAEGFGAVMAEVTKQASDGLADVETASTKVRKRQVELKDATDSAKESFGAIVSEAAPAVISAAAEIAKGLAGVVHMLNLIITGSQDAKHALMGLGGDESEGGSLQRRIISGAISIEEAERMLEARRRFEEREPHRGLMARGFTELGRRFGPLANDLMGGIIPEDAVGLVDLSAADIKLAIDKAKERRKREFVDNTISLVGTIADAYNQVQADIAEAATDAAEKAGKAKAQEFATRADPSRRSEMRFGDPSINPFRDPDIMRDIAGADRPGELNEALQASSARAIEGSRRAAAGMEHLIAKIHRDLAELEAKQFDDMLTTVFGPSREFDARIDVVKNGFDILTESITAAFDAWMIGADNAGAAAEKALHGVTRALAKEFLVMSMGETAWGFARLAKGDLAGSATHFKAAAAFGAGAAFAGSIARASAPSSASGPPPAASGGARATTPGSAGGGAITVFVGSDFAMQDPRRQSEIVRHHVERARKEATGRGFVRDE